ncbi:MULTISPECIES: OmpP1/FadL family transporter [unclassified Lentimonas]|uniref:OmpP1/FadL family transporter n=1 Tax=unclassified Lentimonas TaxID=2630993 RepID=UPI001321215E|nr:MULTISPECIES: outer membrane protein transport protein [unclassified Lentimonas]CAA6697398.1 Unannotated [Lentimonas sp. CC19]CAA6697682.1 Unannotated [Lentimonas sp. CC10]CAA7072072.1 Unannotated [Lentimonas sp. CC11]
MLRTYIIPLTLASFIAAQSTQAAGLWLYETGTEDLGLATAGRAATASDASIAAGNPAGMPLLKESGLVATSQILYINSRFDTEEASFGGGDGGNAGGLVPSGGISYAHKYNDDLWFGISFGSYFGLGLDYGDDWAGRYYVTEAELLTVVLNPSVGYQVNEWLSVGGGIDIVYSTLDQRAAVNNVLDPTFGDGELKLKDDDIDWGYNLGIMIQLSEKTRLGLTYRSEVDIEFNDVAELSNIGPLLEGALGDLIGSKASLDMKIPNNLLLSGFHQLNDDWAIMANIGWQEWSEFGKQELSINSTTATSFTKDLNYDDTWHFALGTQYQINPKLRYSCGISHDTSPADKSNRSPDLPFDRVWRFANGINYQWKENISIGLAYEYMDLGSAEIDIDGGPVRGDLKGEYDINAVHFFAANFNMTF